MAEAFESRFTVIGAESAFAQTTERKPCPHHVRHHIVETDAARTGLREKSGLNRSIVCKEIRRQRRRPIGDHRHGFPQIAGLGSFLAGRSWERGGVTQHLRTILDDSGRPMIFINFNTDMGDGWEWSNAQDYPGYIK